MDADITRDELLMICFVKGWDPLINLLQKPEKQVWHVFNPEHSGTICVKNNIIDEIGEAIFRHKLIKSGCKFKYKRNDYGITHIHIHYQLNNL